MKELVHKLFNEQIEKIDNKTSLRYLKSHDSTKYFDALLATFYLYTRPKRGRNKNIYLTEVIVAIGNTVRGKLKERRDSALAARTGAFFLYLFKDIDVIEVSLTRGNRAHQAYVVNVIDDDFIRELWSELDPHQIEKMPSEVPYAPWTSYKHENGLFAIKTGNMDVVKSITPETHPILFDCLNKPQAIGWRINHDIYGIYEWGLRNKIVAFNDIWNQVNPEAKKTKFREAKAIGDMATKFLNTNIYHNYYFDFRGRKYSNTAYLNETGSDPAKGLLQRIDKKPITERGFYWLLVNLASNAAVSTGREDNRKTDKIPLDDRFAWALDNEEILLSYAENPKVNQGWMTAEKPWQFLAGCLEFKKLREWQEKYGEEYGYESSAEAYLDGTTNGSQHLCALTKDEITAPYVNLVSSKYPGDLYSFVADAVWKEIDKELQQYTKKDLNDFEEVLDDLIEIKKQIHAAEPKSQTRKDHVEKIQAFKLVNKDMIIGACAVFWSRVKDNKERRKIIKRNVMTIPYGATAYGMGNQQIDDGTKHGIELLHYMEHRFGAYMGRKVFASCKIAMKRSMKLLSIFENAGLKAEREERFLSWNVPITNFPVVQNYTNGRVKKIYIQFGPPEGPKLKTGHYKNTLQLMISFPEDPIPAKRKQSQGASPNIIHSLDAAHLMLTIHKADFPVTTIHDSYGCLVSDMDKLYKLLRETFLELYESDPLTSILKDIDADIDEVDIGTLDLKQTLNSEYCFS